MSEWVYTLHLVILFDQHGNSCVHAERVQASNHAKIHLITGNVVTLVGIMELEFEWQWLASTVYSICFSIEFAIYLSWYSSAGCFFVVAL